MILGLLEVKLQVYLEMFSAKVSSAGVWDMGGNEVAAGLEVEVEASAGVWDVGGNEVAARIEAEVEAGEAVDVMMERRETVDEGTTGLVVASLLVFSKALILALSQ